jgi:hypothetical protein
VIAGNDHPINAKYWTGQQIRHRLGTNAGHLAMPTSQPWRTIMALAAVVERMPLRDPLLTIEDVAVRLLDAAGKELWPSKLGRIGRVSNSDSEDTQKRLR